MLSPTERLQHASSLERLGRLDEAVVHYLRALDEAQRQGQWLNRQTTPALLLPLVEHAVRTVRKGRRSLFDRLLAPLIERYGRDSLERVEQCLQIYLRKLVAEYPDPRQRPSFLYFPGLPARAYFERDVLPWAMAFEAETAVIRAELSELLRSASGRERIFASDALEQQNLRGIEAAPTWNGYYFYRYGERREDNCRRCPATARALDALPLARVRGHAPEVLFSVFTAGTHLLPHRGVTNTRVVGHLPLIVPEDCALRVGGEIHEWREGHVVVFDDTYEHEAWNRSRSTRVVLIFDLWNPHLTQAERAALGDIIAAIGDARQDAVET